MSKYLLRYKTEPDRKLMIQSERTSTLDKTQKQ